MYRNSSFDQDLSAKLQDPEFAQGYILTLIEGEEGLPLEEALRQTIERMGVTEFCERSKMRKQNVNELVKGKRRPKPESLDAFLKPFRLRTKVIVEKAS